jgi:hypothetical protein
VTEVVALINSLKWPVLIGLVLVGFCIPIWKLLTSVSTFVASMSNRSLKVGPVEVSGPLQQAVSETTASSQEGLPPATLPAPPGATTSGPRPLAKHFGPLIEEFAVEVEATIEDVILPNAMRQLNIDYEAAMNYVAIDHVAALRLERASRMIFGSQIDAINMLNLVGGRLSIETLRPTYNAAVAAFPQGYTNYSFEQWLAYLTAWDLIKVEGLEVTIRPAGRVIIPYMQRWGYLNIRPPG